MYLEREEARIVGGIMRKGGIYIYPDRYEWQARVFVQTEWDANSLASRLKRIIGKEGQKEQVGKKWVVKLFGKQAVEDLQDLYDEGRKCLDNTEFDGNPFLDVDKENFLLGILEGFLKSGFVQHDDETIFMTYKVDDKDLVLKLLIELGIDHKILGNGNPWKFVFDKDTTRYVCEKNLTPNDIDW